MGQPAGPSEAEGQPSLRSLGILEAKADPKFSSITRLLCTVFNVPTALVNLTPRPGEE